MSLNLDYEKEVALQAKTRRATIEFINIVNDLWYDKSIELVLFRNTLVDKRASEVLNLIDYAKEFVNKAITIQDALSIAKAIQKIDLPYLRLFLFGRFVQHELLDLLNRDNQPQPQTMRNG